MQFFTNPEMNVYLLYAVFIFFIILLLYAYYSVKKYHYVFKLASSKIKEIAKSINTKLSLTDIEIKAEFGEEYYIRELSIKRDVYEESISDFENVCINFTAVIHGTMAATLSAYRDSCRGISKKLQEKTLFEVLRDEFQLETNNEDNLKKIFSSREITHLFSSLGCAHIFNVEVIDVGVFRARILFTRVDDEAILNAIKLIEKMILPDMKEHKKLIFPEH